MALRVVEDHVADVALHTGQHLVDLGHFIHRLNSLNFVMPDLVPGIHVLSLKLSKQDVGGRDIRAFTPVFNGLCPAMTWNHHTAPDLWSAAISPALKPKSLRISSVCWPRSGGHTLSLPGARDSDTGCAMRAIVLLPRFTGWAMPRCITCASKNIWSIA